jgi:hypothetical protein
MERPADTRDDPGLAGPDELEITRRVVRPGDPGVEGNARLTSSTAVVLVVLLALEGATLPAILPLLTPHVFIGLMLVPPVLLKLASTSYRFVAYYRGSAAYRRKGPPPLVLRVLGPFVVLLTVVLFASGIALLLAPLGWRPLLLRMHQVSFIAWFAVMAIHVLGHVREIVAVAPRDYRARSRSWPRGAGLRQWSIVASIALGFVLAVDLVDRVGPYLAR